MKKRFSTVKPSVFRRKALSVLNITLQQGQKNKDLFLLLAKHYKISTLPKAKIDCYGMFLSIMEGVQLDPRFRRHKIISPAAETAFLESYEWRKIRMEVLIRDGRRCVCCGATPETGATMNVDHIKPRRTHPELSLDKTNLQVLCHECNHGKGNWDSTDWRAVS